MQKTVQQMKTTIARRSIGRLSLSIQQPKYDVIRPDAWIETSAVRSVGVQGRYHQLEIGFHAQVAPGQLLPPPDS